jgi:hypothetical protein
MTTPTGTTPIVSIAAIDVIGSIILGANIVEIGKVVDFKKWVIVVCCGAGTHTSPIATSSNSTTVGSSSISVASTHLNKSSPFRVSTHIIIV